MNATAVSWLPFTLQWFDLDLVRAKEDLFAGVKRRLPIMEQWSSEWHLRTHPAEIIATFDAARQKYSK